MKNGNDEEPNKLCVSPTVNEEGMALEVIDLLRKGVAADDTGGLNLNPYNDEEGMMLEGE